MQLRPPVEGSLTDPQIVVFNKGGRDFRLEALQRGEEVPREFLYGYLDIQAASYRVRMQSSAGAVPGFLGAGADFAERLIVGTTGIGMRPLSARLRLASIADPAVIISFTDGFSLSLGLALPRPHRRRVVIGGFQGLSDIEGRSRFGQTSVGRSLIRRALEGLDHVFFLSPADRVFATGRYGLAIARSSILDFGVDTDYWRPLPEQPPEDFVFAIGQDLNRDFDCLAAAPGGHPIRIVTPLKVNVPAGSDNVQIAKGDFSGRGSLSDSGLRALYNAARAVVVPIKDVFQPSGQSVIMQAMSCGRPVIFTRTRGLWAPELLKDGENCLSVPPGDARALGDAIALLRGDRALGEKLGRAARKTALDHFGLDKLGAGVVGLARRGLSMAAA